MKKPFILFLFFIAFNGYTNNILISNVTTINQNTTSHYTFVQFDISWDNSWRTSTGPSNWDAAWVFIKYRIKNESVFKHATINTTPANHTAPTGSTIYPTTDGKGVFIYRNADGSGTFSLTSVQLRWEYGTDGVLDADIVEVRVLGVEMVHVPTGSFYLGSGYHNATLGEFYAYQVASASYTAQNYQVTSENAITVGTAAGNLYYASTGFSGDRAGPIPANFPKGYSAFYCMKYEISHEQMIDFLNMQQKAQADNVDYPLTTQGHNETGTHPNITTTCPTRAYNFMAWTAAAAYADWAALRPMSELEYEKACRGPLVPQCYEYAWGNSNNYNLGTYTITNSGAQNEAVSNAGSVIGNALISSTAASQSPLRCGVFATSTSSREEAGATYYGIMEMSGNLWELCVSVGIAAGRAFTGVHGDGSTAVNGFANITTWPGYVAGNLSVTDNSTSNLSISQRGGSFGESDRYMRVSDRYYGSYYMGLTGQMNYGARFVRTSPTP